MLEFKPRQLTPPAQRHFKRKERKQNIAVFLCDQPAIEKLRECKFLHRKATNICDSLHIKILHRLQKDKRVEFVACFEDPPGLRSVGRVFQRPTTCFSTSLRRGVRVDASKYLYRSLPRVVWLAVKNKLSSNYSGCKLAEVIRDKTTYPPCLFHQCFPKSVSTQVLSVST